MRSAKLKEERLKAAVKLSPEDNPKLYENVLELAELMDALVRPFIAFLPLGHQATVLHVRPRPAFV